MTTTRGQMNDKPWRARSVTALAFAAVVLVATLALSVFEARSAQAQDIDMNAADAGTIATLPGIGKTTAKAIVKHRTDNGPFSGPKDLLKVKGIGKKTLAKIEDRLIFGGTEDAEGAPGGGDDAGGDVAAKGGMSLQRSNRMEFDGRLIRGETAGAGAVFLFERAPRPLPSMVKKRTSYLADTIRSVMGPQRDKEDKRVLAEAAAKQKAEADKAKAADGKKGKKRRRRKRSSRKKR